ncbi:hypothetical protein RAA17_20485 [Komagataeibacter rhaeticus]|nr:hypothetical protein [Komagataeibacter rhaeticus]
MAADPALPCDGAAGALGLAQPVFPRGQTGLADTDCLIVVDNGWAAATWSARLHALDGLLDHLARTGHGARLLLTAPDDALTPVSVQPVRQAQVLRGMLDPLLPRAWPVDRMAATQALGQLARQGWHGPVIYVSDGLATPADGGFATALAAIGPVHEMQVPDSDITLLAPGRRQQWPCHPPARGAAQPPAHMADPP